MTYTQHEADNKWRGIYVVLDQLNNLDFKKENLPTTPRTVTHSRKRLAGAVTAYVKRMISSIPDVSVQVVQLQYGYTANKPLEGKSDIKLMENGVRYSKEAVIEHLGRSAKNLSMGRMLAELIDNLGPDFLQVEIVFKGINNIKYPYTYEFSMHHLAELHTYAKPDADTEGFWIPFASSEISYRQAVSNGDHEDYLRLVS